MKKFLFLAIAIVLETIATSAMKSSDQFSKWLPTAVTLAGYIGAFYFLSLTLKSIPIGVAHALWSGIGIVLITVVGIFLYKQVPDFPAVIGQVLIIVGVIVINLFSKTSIH
ncbi:multidrug efflux SMR transporter [Olivibacter sp. SDN3]|uniref:DMT family transporter n=1 Tax=Olivibacter sp. SDN3 TaxID=2764720 RepID=UPI0016517919|nr:multidrug efflux SMR transporter [Olivibacter sp. SDN3]QNL49223.1 multidrug efflux SMR transporter [Olivibacter sp. SDN3]